MAMMNTDNLHVISASAGTGKTTQLLQDVLADLLRSTLANNPGENAPSIRQSLIITFTVKAAAEMRRRLEANLRYAINYANKNADCRPGQTLVFKDDEHNFVLGGDSKDLCCLILAHPDDAQTVFGQALEDLPSAQISTIDALAKRIVDRNPDACKAVPNARILSDEAIRNGVRRHVLDELFEGWYAGDIDEELRAKGTSFLDILDGFGGPQHDDALRQRILDLHRKALTKPYVQADDSDDDSASGQMAWLGHISEPYDFAIEPGRPAYDASPIVGNLIAQCEASIAGPLEDAERLSDEVSQRISDGRYTPEKKQSFPEDSQFFGKLPLLRSIQSRLRSGDWDTLRGILHDPGVADVVQFGAQARWSAFRPALKKQKDADQDDFDELNARGNRLVGEIQEPLQRLLSLFAFSADDMNRMNTAIAHRLDGLVCLITRFDTAYRQYKAQEQLADFSDVAAWALDALDHDEVSRRIGRLWTHIYVDECQDDNDLQNQLIGRIGASAEKITMVGDVKQSIYGFRDASPNQFLQLCEAVPESHRASKQTNHRSVPELVTFVNSVFDGLMTKDMGRVDYRGEHRLQFDSEKYKYDRGHAFNGEAVELLIRKAAGSGNDDDSDSVALDDQGRPVGNKRSGSPQREVDMIVDRIVELHDSEHYDYGDIAVLARGTTHFGDLYERLQVHGIPVEVKGVGDFYRKPEIMIAVDWLRIIDNAHQDAPLVAVLRALGFSDEELALLRLSSKGMFVDSLVVVSAHGVASGLAGLPAVSAKLLQTKCGRFLDMLWKLKRYAATHTTDQLLWRLYTVTGLYDYVGKLPDGGQRRANLEVLNGKARAFADMRWHTLNDFITSLDEWATDASSAEEASTVPTRDAVHIMTIHKAKGLQWPVVILMGAGNAVLGGAHYSSMVAVAETAVDADGRQSEHGVVGTVLKDPHHDITLENFQYDELRRRAKLSDAAEELRLLYVALTRAERKLIIAGQYNPTNGTPGVDFGEMLDGFGTISMKSVDGSRYDVVAPDSLVYRSTYLYWIVAGIAASSGRISSESESEWQWPVIMPDSDGTPMPLPQDFGAIDGVTAIGGMRIRVIFDDSAAEDPTLMTAATPGFEYTRRRLDIAKLDASLDEPDRVPALANSSDARNWMGRIASSAESAPSTDGGDAAGGVSEVEGPVEQLFGSAADSDAETNRIPANEFGTAVHAVLELFDWSVSGDGTVGACREELENEIGLLERRGLIRHAVADAIRAPHIMDGLLWFVTGGEPGKSDDKGGCSLAPVIRGNRGRLHREEPFAVLRSDVKSVLAGNGAEKKIADDTVIRGVIDGYVVVPGADGPSIVLFDYKTDRRRQGEPVGQWESRLRDEYRQQQALYAAALERRYRGCKVVQRWLVGLDGRRLIDVR